MILNTDLKWLTILQIDGGEHMAESSGQAQPATSITDSFHWHDSVGSLVLGIISLVLLAALLRCNASRLKEAAQR